MCRWSRWEKFARTLIQRGNRRPQKTRHDRSRQGFPQGSRIRKTKDASPHRGIHALPLPQRRPQRPLLHVSAWPTAGFEWCEAAGNCQEWLWRGHIYLERGGGGGRRGEAFWKWRRGMAAGRKNPRGGCGPCRADYTSREGAA